jgi:hypothetical protein
MAQTSKESHFSPLGMYAMPEPRKNSLIENHRYRKEQNQRYSQYLAWHRRLKKK